MNFIIINKDFLGIYKDTFGLIDIIEADFIPTLSHVSICFVVKTDIDKLNFLKEKYSVCYNEYLFYIEKKWSIQRLQVRIHGTLKRRSKLRF